MAHRRAVPILILLLLSQLAVLGYCHASHQIRFYIYGSASCPHSRRLNETLAQVYGAEAVVFNKISRLCVNSAYYFEHFVPHP